MKRILVLGSVNTDMVTRSPRFPLPGETITALSFATFFGGKGANQAIALGRLGMKCDMAGLVGDDAFGGEYRRHFEEEGVGTELLGTAPGSTGTASITVDDQTGNNNILVVPGANAACDDAWLKNILPACKEYGIALLQLEIPHDTVFSAIRSLHEAGTIVILDPAPACPLPDDILPFIDYITPNETELATLVPGLPCHEAMETLRKRGVGTVIRKSGDDGAYVLDDKGLRHIPGFSVKAVDTTAAGDTFNAGLAAALADDKDTDEAIRFANAAAAISVTRPGAQGGMPTTDQVISLLRNN